MHAQDPESSRPESASANGFANETGRDGGRRRETPGTLMEAFAWSARRAGTSETRETCVVVLITQRRLAVNVSMRQYMARTRHNRQSKPASGALREACLLPAHALAAPMTPLIALMALGVPGYLMRRSTGTG